MVRSTPYIVAVAAAGNTSSRLVKQVAAATGQGMTIVTASSSSAFQHHQLIGTGGRLCRHLHEVATMQTAALYLAPAAFTAPFEEQHQLNEGEGEEAAASRAQAYMAFLTDPTRLIANPGLRASVRPDVTLLGQATEIWRQHAFASPLNNYIVRRRAATPSGVLLTYPGSSAAQSAPDDEDPRREPWYRGAVSSPGQVVVGPPHLDPGGAGYILTLSRTVVRWGRIIFLH